MAQDVPDFAAYFEERGLGGGGGGEGETFSVRAGMVLFLVLAGVYAAGFGLAGVERFHHVALNALAVVLYGILVGWGVFTVYRAFRRSSGGLLVLLGVVFALAAFHADWLGFFVLEGKGLRLRPDGFLAGLAEVVGKRSVDFVFEGHEKMSVRTISGPLLAACHFLELVLIGGTAGVTARLFNRGAFFCAACGRWTRNRRVLPPLYVRVPEAMALVTLAKGDVSSLRTANPVPNAPGDEPFVATVRYCAECRRGMLWVSRLAISGRGAKKRQISTAIKCLQRIPLEPEAVRTLLELA